MNKQTEPRPEPRPERFLYTDDEAATLQISQCAFCRHKLAGPYCDAYPEGDGIPEAILLNQHDHREPYVGDGGVLYEEVLDGGDERLDDLFEQA